jgi:S-DNA-T family DNA segregation ATPase FtsK/SpoIIIE
VLVDFKGGATFTRLDGLPHTSALITNLAEELELVDRMTDAMNGELVRRQELLRAAGNFASLRDYEKARAAGSDLPEVPTLFVVVDEFSELLTAKPDFIDTFVQIGRVGRSLGVHLLLASQRLDEGRLRGLDAHLSYRIGLRTFSEMDSRAVLGSGDAFRLPRPPGHGFLKMGMDTPIRFRSAYVSGVHHRLTAGTTIRPVSDGLELMEYSTEYRVPARESEDQPAPDQADDDAVGESLMDILVDRLSGRGTPAHQVWLPPLDESPAVGALNGALSTDPVRGLGAGRADLTVTVGIVDRPYEQRRDPLVLDLSAGAGHVVIFGAPRSGRSTAVQTIVTGLALRHTPAEVQFYCLDFGGGSLGALRGLPHVGSVASRQNEGLVRRTIAEVTTLLDQRERAFAELEVDNIAAYRALRAAGGVPDDPYGDVFLVIDGWGTIRSEFEEQIDVIADIAARGLSYGVHLVVTCARSYELRLNMRDLFGTRLELRLGDPLDSMVDRISAASVPADRPGRGITMTKHQMLVALPRIDAGDNGLQELVSAVASSWPGAPAPRVRTLPALLPAAELPPADAGHQLTIGIAENDLGPVQLDFGAEPHFMVFGDAEAGKTNFLRLLARRIVSSYSPDEARIMLVDHRRGLLGEVPEEYLLGYGTDKPATAGLVQSVARVAADRMPPADITPEKLRRRGWWAGPELFVLVDDYDMIASAMDNPFMPLFDYLQHGRETGLHLVLTHRTNGAGRSLYQQFMSRMRDIGTPGLMMSGDRLEGALLGGLRPEALPPGRGRLVRHRGGVQLIQLAWSPPSE